MVSPAGLLSNRYRVEDMPDLSGKVAVVTGGSRGIGGAAVSALAQKGCEVHMIGATPEHLEEAVKSITSHTPSASSLLHTHALDLGDLKTLIPSIKKLGSTLERLDMLYLIAGVGVAPFGLTKDGLGNHYAINYLSHLAIADILIPKMVDTSEKKQPGPNDWEKYSTRIIIESSELHRGVVQRPDCENIEEMNKEYDAAYLYNRSKLFDIYLARELSVRLPPLNSPYPIMAISVHPGAVGTEQQQGATEAYGKVLGGMIETAGQYLFKSPEEGAESALWAGTSKSVSERKDELQGAYIDEADGKVGKETNLAKDKELPTQLWDLSKRVLKDKAGYEVQL